MKKEITISDNKNLDDSDFLYWSTKNPEEKLSAVQTLREQYVTLFNKKRLYNESRKGLRRFCKVVKQKQS